MNDHDGHISKRRLASGQACNNCRKRKNRCDGVHPQCGCCRSRGIPCRYPRSATSDLSYEELQSLYLEARASREQTTTSRHDELSPRALISHDHHNVELIETRKRLSPSQTTRDLFNGHSSHGDGSVRRRKSQCGLSVGAPSQPDDYSPQSASPSESRELNGYFGSSSTFAFVSEVRLQSLPNKETHVGQRLDGSRCNSRTSTERGSSSQCPSSFDEICQLPNRELADRLVDAYFDHVHPLYPFVHEPSFRIKYERVLTSHPPSRENTDEIWIGLLNLILAYGCEFCDTVPQQDLLDLSSRFLTHARRLLLSHIFRSGSLELVQALLLMCHYLQGTLELDECWNLVGVMIRIAVGVGLHLNPSRSSLNSIEIEMRKRIWWGCVIIDRTLSMKFGRPPSVQQLEEFDTDLPLNVDDQYIADDFITPRQPVGHLSLMSFFIQTCKQSKVIDRILHDLYLCDHRNRKTTSRNPEKSTESLILGKTVSLDGQLLSWWSSTPHHLRQSPEAPEGPEFQRQRNVIFLRFLNLRLLLHRKSFLIFSQQDIHDSFQRAIAVASAQICVNSAQKTIHMIHALYRQGLANSLWYNLHYIFTAMGVLLLLRTIDVTKRNTLDFGDEQETLDCGIEFLQVASGKSALAARYVTILQKLAEDTNGSGAIRNPDKQRNHELDQPQTQLDECPVPMTLQTTWEQDEFEEIFSQQALDSFSLDFDNILFGFGLARDPESTSHEYVN